MGREAAIALCQICRAGKNSTTTATDGRAKRQQDHLTTAEMEPTSEHVMANKDDRDADELGPRISLAFSFDQATEY